MFPLFQNPVDLAHHFWLKIVQPGDLLIDATCGNGHDTEFLIQLKPHRLYALDLQSEALEAAQKRIGTPENVKFVQGCHSKFPAEIEPETVKLIVYNLGYLPGGDKARTTLSETTLTSIQEALKLLLPGGVISIICYPGHAEGAREEAILLSFIESLDKETWEVTHQTWLNRKKGPRLLLIQRTNRKLDT